MDKISNNTKHIDTKHMIKIMSNMQSHNRDNKSIRKKRRRRRKKKTSQTQHIEIISPRPCLNHHHWQQIQQQQQHQVNQTHQQLCAKTRQNIIIKTTTTTITTTAPTKTANKLNTLRSTAITKRKRFIDNKWQQWCNRVLFRRCSSSKIIVKMCNQTTVNSYQQENRKWEHLRKIPTKAAKPTTNILNYFYFNSRYDLNVQHKFIAISLIGISLLVNCKLIAASNSTSASGLFVARLNHQYQQQQQQQQQYSPNNIHNHDGRRQMAWMDFQKKMLHQRSVPAYQSPQDLGDILTQLGVLIQARQRNATELATNIFFKYYNSDGELTYQSSLSSPRDLYAARCNPKERFAIVLHGWREDCSADWSQQLIKKLGKHRGGCILCMDYGKYSSESYVRLVRLFDPLAQILTLQLYLLDYMGFDMNKGYLFGFSYGGQLATEAGRRIGYRRLKEIDTCDMAGPGFDHRSNQPNHRDAAQNVQCIHTSRDKGTRFYNCHQDWRLGNCGLTQIASNSPPLGSHGLCPYMYVNSFDHEFYAIEKPKDCISKHEASYWPNNFKMGYMENRKWQVSGELFAHTSRFHPFNLIGNGSVNNAIIQEQYKEVPLTMQEILPDSSVISRLKEQILRYIFLDHN